MALIDLIEESIVRVPLLAADKDGVIVELISLLADQGKLSDKAEVYRAVMEREAKGSTGLEDGVAVPHGKTPAVKGLTVAIGISPAGVDFASQDGKPSRLFFLILAPPDQAGPHIEALAEIARLSQSQAFCRTLAASRTGAQVVSLFRGE